MDKQNKKGVVSLKDVPAAVMVLVVIGIFLGIGAIILQEIQDNQQTQSGDATVNNETQATIVQDTVTTLDAKTAGTLEFASSIFNVVNNSVVEAERIVIDSGNYTDGGDGTFTPTNTTPIGAAGWNVSYTWSQVEQTAFYNTTVNSLDGTEDFSSFMPIIAIVIAAAVILGVVFLIRT